MPIKIPNGLPATKTLQEENIFVMSETRAMTQDIRPLNILILNLMPTKIDTETQLSRLLGNSPLQVDVELMTVSSHESKNIKPEHLLTFYKTFDQIKHRKFDGMIITGAPIEKMEFEEVDYWDELKEIMDWSTKNVHSTFHICWGAQAGLFYHYGIGKYPLDEKMFGVFHHEVTYKRSILFRGFDEVFMVPHSRHTTIKQSDVEKVPALKILARSDVSGVYAVSSNNGRQIFIMGHSEYDGDTLKKEYFRDKNAGLPIAVPANYFRDNDDEKEPMITWRAHANLLYSNWLNYYVYQSTSYDIEKI